LVKFLCGGVGGGGAKSQKRAKRTDGDAALWCVQEAHRLMPKCLISSRSTDGVGNQLYSKLACMAAIDKLLDAAEYVHQPITVADHENRLRSRSRRDRAPTPAELNRAFSEPIEACNVTLYKRHMRRIYRPGSAVKPHGQMSGKKWLCDAAARRSSMLWNLTTRTGGSSCEPGVVYSGHSCMDYAHCTSTFGESTYQLQPSACVRAAFHSAHATPREFDRNRTNIAVHVRRGDVHRDGAARALGYDGVSKGGYFDRTMDSLRREFATTTHPAHFWLLSDERGGEAHLAALARRRADVTLPPAEANRSVIADFGKMLRCDVLVLSPSALSHAAALLKGNASAVVAPDCWTFAGASGAPEVQMSNFAVLPHWRRSACCPASVWAAAMRAANRSDVVHPPTYC
jgi:hypothetical protein